VQGEALDLARSSSSSNTGAETSTGRRSVAHFGRPLRTSTMPSAAKRLAYVRRTLAEAKSTSDNPRTDALDGSPGLPNFPVAAPLMSRGAARADEPNLFALLATVEGGNRGAV